LFDERGPQLVAGGFAGNQGNDGLPRAHAGQACPLSG
jgi:hypothetical protein